MGLTGGLPLQTALTRACDEIRVAHPDLATELRIVRRQAEAGNLEYALQRLAERVDLEEVTNLTLMVSHAERMGSPVGVVLRDNADSLRRARMQKAEERGSKISLKMLFPIVLCLVPAAYIVVLAPPLLNLKNFHDHAHEPGGILAKPDMSRQSSSPKAKRIVRPKINRNRAPAK